MVDKAVGFAIVTMFAWGGWAIFAKRATESLRPETAMILSYGVGAVVALGYVLLRGISIDLLQEGTTFAILAGISSAIGAITLYAGLKHGNASIVTTISALYFVVATVLSVVLFGSSIGITDVAGIACAILAIILLTA
jgi:transporter family protein